MKTSEPNVASFVIDSYAKQSLQSSNKQNSHDQVALASEASNKYQSNADVESKEIPRNAKIDASDNKKVEEAVSLVQRFLDSSKRGVNFSIDDSTDKTVITVTDKQTKELVRQLPSEEMLRIAEKIKELEQELTNKVGILIDSKA
ncbi:flagellar protein FlaG [Motilimonas sp. E26]|uniref:flagellar protein FlaG n=1 Tax=Motilimonas sp. E26 TaxID=2865674 RepID=UPI001E2EA6F9|nr:flagellar protein FlaG [Motilimonas sp. E26]MCE0556208.1 flagellar protein FlaG [Motilimonas sp. E26]